MTVRLICGGLALGLTCALGPAVLGLLRRLRVLDHPSERSSHVSPVPRGGGIAPALGAMVALTVAPALPVAERWAILGAAGAFGAAGLVEDMVGIKALPRLGLQFLIAGAAGALLLDDLGGHLLWRVGFAVGAVFWLVAFVNAFNFMDGINGISVAQAVSAGVSWFLLGTYTGTPVLAAGGVIVAGAALGFAPFNLPHARMFLGDVGSYFFGAWLAAVAILGLRAGVLAEAVLAPLVLYVADTGATLARRVARGESWYLPHREHAYQRLYDGGWSHVRVASFVSVCILASGALGAVSLIGSGPERVAADIAVAGVVGGYLLAPRWLARGRSALVVA